jgi:hypothetical protein
MLGCSLDIALTYPPRSLRPEERQILAAWLVAPGNAASAYINERRSDPPSLYRKIVVLSAQDSRPTHLIWTATGVTVWMVQQTQTSQLCGFGSLRDALDYVWEELPGRRPDQANMTERVSTELGAAFRPRVFSDGEREGVMQWSAPVSAATQESRHVPTFRAVLNLVGPVSERSARHLLRFPARPPMAEESDLVAEWLAAADDVVFAFVSSRRDDDPALLHRVVIGVGPGNRPSHVVHAPRARDIWMVFAVGGRMNISRFLSLRAALNSIRPVLVASQPLNIAAKENDR